MSSVDQLKIVIIGDYGVGKTWLVRSFLDKTLSSQSPTSFDNYTVSLKHHNKTFQLSIWDTAGQEQYDKLRCLSYPQTDIFIVCYAINNISSFNTVMKWATEVKSYSEKIIIVGCKSDTRRDFISEGDVVSEEYGKKFADDNKMNFLECSALEKNNVKEVFKMCVEMMEEKKEKRKKMVAETFLLLLLNKKKYDLFYY
ncbi:Rho GTPase protein rac1 [Gurleya vavrai]